MNRSFSQAVRGNWGETKKTHAVDIYIYNYISSILAKGRLSSKPTPVYSSVCARSAACAHQDVEERSGEERRGRCLGLALAGDGEAEGGSLVMVGKPGRLGAKPV